MALDTCHCHIGPIFWRTSKRIRAVSDYNPAAFQDSSSDSDFELSPRKHTKTSSKGSALEE